MIGNDTLALGEKVMNRVTQILGEKGSVYIVLLVRSTM